MSIVYKAGYDTVIVEFSNLSELRAIRQAVGALLIGYEIIEQSTTKCVIQTVSFETNDSLENLVRRSIQVACVLAKEAYDAFVVDDAEKLRESLILEETNNRLTNLAHRILMGGHEQSHSRTIFTYVFLWGVESIADCFKRTALEQIKEPVKWRAQELAYMKDVCVLCDLLASCFYTFSLDKLKRTSQSASSLEARGRSLLATQPRLVHLYVAAQLASEIIGSLVGSRYDLAQ